MCRHGEKRLENFNLEMFFLFLPRGERFGELLARTFAKGFSVHISSLLPLHIRAGACDGGEIGLALQEVSVLWRALVQFGYLGKSTLTTATFHLVLGLHLNESPLFGEGTLMTFSSFKAD